MRSLTNRAFNLNFFVHPAPRRDDNLFAAVSARLAPWRERLGLGDPPQQQPDLPQGFDAAKLVLLLELRPPVVSFHFGLPDQTAMAALKSAGIIILSTASNVAEARSLEAQGVDAVIAQGWEAGGHRGSHVPTAPWEGVGTMALIPQVADAVRVPVIAAGGIGDGRGIAAAMALGAAGVQMGTAFLSCPEAATDPPRRARLRNATDTDTMVTDAISGRAARTLRSRYAEEMERMREPRVDYPALYALTRPVVEHGAEDDVNFHLYGQAAALNVELPARALMERLVAEAQRNFARLRIQE